MRSGRRVTPKSFLDFPDDLLELKQVQVNGGTVPQSYLVPNLTGPDKKPINYRQYILKAPQYLTYSPLNQGEARKALPGNGSDVPFKVLVTAQDISNGSGYPTSYAPTASILEKKKGLIFRLKLLRSVPDPWSVKFIVKNHGKEAEDAGKQLGHQPFDDHESNYGTFRGVQEVINKEGTAFRGLHYMLVELRDGNGTKYRSQVGVYVK